MYIYINNINKKLAIYVKFPENQISRITWESRKKNEDPLVLFFGSTTNEEQPKKEGIIQVGQHIPNWSLFGFCERWIVEWALVKSPAFPELGF